MPHLQYPYGSQTMFLFGIMLIILNALPGLTCVEECDSESLCSPCAMQYHDYTKDSLLTSWLPPLAHIENGQRCKGIAQPRFQCGSGSHQTVKGAPSTAASRLVHKMHISSLKNL